MLIMDRQGMMWIACCVWIICTVPSVRGTFSIVARKPTNITVLEGKTVTLTCDLTIDNTTIRENTRLRWLANIEPKDLNGLTSTGDGDNSYTFYTLVTYPVRTNGTSEVNYIRCNNTRCSLTAGYAFSSLNIEDIRVKDEGTYICHIIDVYNKVDFSTINLKVETPPTWEWQVPESKPNENSTITITCTAVRVYPLPAEMQILLNGTVISTITSPNAISQNSEDGSYRVETTYSYKVNRNDNLATVSCKAMVNKNMYTSNQSAPLNVVWPPAPPNSEDFSVQGILGACLVEWKKVDNADNVTICHENPDTGNKTCETFQQETGLNTEEIGQSIAAEKNYNVSVYISNRLGNSGNSTAEQCKNLKLPDPTVGPPESSRPPESLQPSTAVVAGAGAAGLVVIIIIAVIVIVVVVRRMKRTNINEEDSNQLKELYADVKKTPNPPGGGRSAPPVSAPPQDVQYATVPGPQIPQKSDELQRELDGQDPYDVVHMKQPTIVPQPKLPKKDKDINGNKKTSKEKPRAHQNGMGNPNAPGNHVTTPPESHTIPPSSNSHVTPPPSLTNSHMTPPRTANSHVTAPPRSQKTAPKKASHVTPPPHANEYGDTTTYARVAIQPQTPGKKPPQPQPRVENTEYFAVQFHPVPKNGIPKEDEDSD